MVEPADGDSAAIERATSDSHPSDWHGRSSLLRSEFQTRAVAARHWLPSFGAIMATLALGALLTALYLQVLRDLARQWWDDANYSHGFLVPLFSAFLVWQRRRELEHLPRVGSWLGLPLFLFGIAALVLGDIGA